MVLSRLIAYDDSFRPTHDTTKQGFVAFVSDLNNILETYGMMLKIERDEAPKGNGWVVLVWLIFT